jgi:hypothetical protein
VMAFLSADWILYGTDGVITPLQLGTWVREASTLGTGFAGVNGYSKRLTTSQKSPTTKNGAFRNTRHPTETKSRGEKIRTSGSWSRTG